MKDAEINLAIAKIEYPNDSWRMTHGDGVARVAGQDLIVKDYCNNWTDIGPIIERENMCLECYNDGAIAYRIDGAFETRSETPTKAAALCYLKMRESE